MDISNEFPFYLSPAILTINANRTSSCDRSWNVFFLRCCEGRVVAVPAKAMRKAEDDVVDVGGKEESAGCDEKAATWLSKQERAARTAKASLDDGIMLFHTQRM